MHAFLDVVSTWDAFTCYIIQSEENDQDLGHSMRPIKKKVEIKQKCMCSEFYRYRQLNPFLYKALCTGALCIPTLQWPFVTKADRMYVLESVLHVAYCWPL